MHYTELEQVNDKLKEIVTELDEASSRTDDLEDAIGNPFGKSALRKKAGDFESRWDDKRRDLSRDIAKVQQHVQGIVDGLKNWDADTAKQFEVDVSGENAPRPV